MRISKKSLVVYIIIALIIVAAVWFGPELLKGTKSLVGGGSQSTNGGVMTPEAVAVAGTYEHPDDLFTFVKPAGYSVARSVDGDGRDVLLIQPAAGTLQEAFQIGITELEYPFEVTPDLIRQEIPDITISDAKQIVLDEEGKGVMFGSNNPAFDGASFEIWFTTKTHLYQVSSYAAFGDELQAIIGTWKF